MCSFIRTLLFLASWLCLPPAMSQNSVVVSGVVADKQGNPLPFVTVSVEHTTTGTYTDERGIYSLRVHPGEMTLVVSAVGYKTLKRSSVIRQNETQDFVLEEDAILLKSVEVYG